MAKTKEQTPFEELILKLKSAKKPNVFSADLVDELINAAVAGAVAVVKRKEKVSDIESLQLARMVILQHIDQILQETHENGGNFRVEL